MTRTRLTLAAAATLCTTVIGANQAIAAPDPSHCVGNICVVLVDLDADSDGDGFADSDEKAAGTDPYDASSHPPVLDVIIGILDGTSPGFWQEHATELVVLPLLAPDGSSVVTGLGAFLLDTGIELPTKTAEQRAGLTLHQQLGFDMPGMTIDPGQSLFSTGSSAPGDRWSLVAGGKSPSAGTNTTQITYAKDGSATRTVVETDAKGNGTSSITESRRDRDGGTISTTTASALADGKPTGASTTTSVSSHTDSGGNQHTTTSSRTVDEDGKTTHLLDTTSTRNADGTSHTTSFEVDVHADGSKTVTESKIERDANGEVITSSTTVTNLNANGDKVSETTSSSCKGDACEYWDPDLEMAMGWTTTLTPEDFQRVGSRLNSTILTVQGWTPPPVDPSSPPVTTSPNGPLVALIDPDSAVTVIATGAPRFTSAQPDYDPRLDGLRNEIIAGGQLPQGTSPYQHDEP